MKNVTTAYHNANKADTRSSDFLIVADTGFDLDRISATDGWSFKRASTVISENEFTMYRYNGTTKKDVTDYGYISFGSYTYYRYYDTECSENGITICFEPGCYPTTFDIEFYNCGNSIITPAVTATNIKNDSHILSLSYSELFSHAAYQYSNLQVLKFYFREWSKQGVRPVILFGTYGKPSAVFTKDDLLSVDITLETDPTAQSIPYNSYACTVIDEVDAYNPLLQDSKIYDFAPNQKFKFFNFEKGFEKNEAITDNLSLFDHEICPVGTAYFRSAIQQGTAVSFEFIDIVEKYDNIYLSDSELGMSSHFTKKNVKEYLNALFGSSLDTSSVPATLEAITPFYTESKAKILLYMAQLMQKYIYVTPKGILSFKERQEWNEDFCIELAQSYQNPVIEKNYENNGVEVNAYGYSVSQNSELAFNRIEFLYDGEVKAYSDGNEIFDSETEEQIFEFPKHDFTFLGVNYRLNDIYDKNSLFSVNAGSSMTIKEVIAEVNKKLFSAIELSDKRILDIMCYFDYCDTYVNFQVAFLDGEISAKDKLYSEIMQILIFPLLVLNNLQGCKITTTTNSVKKQKSNSGSSAVTINNPAITDLETAKAVRDWVYSQIENSAFSIDTDWRGDCSLEIGDDSTAEIAITQNGVKDYESRYIGTVVKNVIEYNGALKMQTTLHAPSQKRWN